MIIMDFSQLAKTGVYVEAAENFDEATLKQHVMNRFKNLLSVVEDRDVVVACDGKQYWRRAEYEYYKAARKVKSKNDDYDWARIHQCFDALKKDIRDFFPYRVIDVFEAEADDVIYTICALNEKQNIETVIFSDDGDFHQLHSDNIKQYAPRKKEWLTSTDTSRDLLNKVLSGDRGDGIPNVLSDDDVFVEDEKRQCRLTQPMKDAAYPYWNGKDLDDEFYAAIEANKIWPTAKKNNISASQIKKNFERNSKLIDLRNVPKTIQDKIQLELMNKPLGDSNTAMQFFVNNNMSKFSQNLWEFL